MKVERLDHVHIFVNDLEKSQGLFSKFLNTTFCTPGTQESIAVKFTLSPLGIELIQPTSSKSPIARSLEQKGEGLAGLSFKVSNLDEAVEELKSLGMEVIGQIKVGDLREVQFNPKDSCGVLIELCEYEEVHPTIPSIFTS